MTRRHEGLIPLTHDHHHALAQIRRLKIAAKAGGRELSSQSQVFLTFFHDAGVRHFREEEEIVFPMAVDDDRAFPLMQRLMMDHLKIHALAARLALEVAAGRATADTAIELAISLESHIRVEERELFPILGRIIESGGLEVPSSGEGDRSAIPS